MSDNSAPRGMSAAQARRVEYAIIALCIAALAMIFQPFFLTLFSIGAVLAVVGGLAFNLVPLCRPGAPARGLWKAAGIVLAILLVAACIAIASAHLFGLYLQSR